MSDYWDELEKMEEERDAQEYAEVQAYKNGWNDAIDEFMERLEELIKHGIFISRNGLFEDIEYIAEELKEQKK